MDSVFGVEYDGGGAWDEPPVHSSPRHALERKVAQPTAVKSVGYMDGPPPFCPIEGSAMTGVNGRINYITFGGTL